MTTMPEQCKDATECLLIVEGKDDCHSILHLASQYSCETIFGIWQGENDEGALEKFGGLLVASIPKRPRILGIVLDSDKGPSQRWFQIVKKLEGFGYSLPPEPSPNGTIIQGSESYPKIGVWLMPDNQAVGMLEDFLLQLAPKDAVDYARTCAQSAKSKGLGNYKTGHESKAVAHTYLAWQDEPGRPLGLAIKCRSFDINIDLAAHFMTWLKELFGGSNEAPAPIQSV